MKTFSKQLPNKNPNLKKVIIASLINVFGFLFLTNFTKITNIPYVSFFGLLTFGLVAFYLAFGLDSIKILFQRPKHPIRNILIYLTLALIIGFATSLVLKALIPTLQGNPENGRPIWFYFLIMPFALLGEEVFSLFWYELASIKFSPLLSSLISATIFGLMHFSTYFDGSAITTLVHVLLLQSVSRIIFNRAYQKSGSIWCSFGVHYILDLILFMFPILFQR
ncbi:CPBP family intramembrane glutamic endopeptidase [Enterococcus sp. AZ196]|uniref:CPBP family intramembrane glutamic endopeptidase n=1 Tax=Enterococcus sp. AZ196 TaxID=2774659 RepID=UPI003D2834C6